MKQASQMSVFDVADKIQSCMKQVVTNVELLDELADKKALSIAEYDKRIAMKELLLKEKHPVTLIKDLAKGDCCNYRYEMEVATSKYKSTLTKIESYQAILNGWQSINKYLQIVAENKSFS